MKEIRDSNIKVAVIGFIGYGEPLFNPYICQMSQLARKLFPESLIFVDTNANHSARKARNLANCGLDEVRMGIDGIDQVSYEKYRERGNFDKSIKFAKALFEETKRIGSSTKPIWKYILFNHNDSDEQIRKAMQMADEIGVKILFHLTSTPNKSLRKDENIISLVGMSRIGSNVDKKHRAEDY
jgi:pyruvate-formate lyase-activating enzyme